MSLEPLNVRAIARKGESEHGAGLIEIKQLPVIAERLREVKDSVELALKEATGLACTEETVKDVKTRRAELNKQFAELEEARKSVKKAILKPYEDFEAVYRDCISEPFKAADAALREKVTAVEGELKRQCMESLRAYFGEVCAVNGVDFLTLEKAMEIGHIKIGMSDARAKAPKALQDSVALVACTVANHIDQIKAMEDSAEIMAEYKQRFDVGASVAAVQERKRRIEAERKAAEQRAQFQAAQAEAARKVEAVMPPAAVQSPEPEKVFPVVRLTLKNITKTQVKRLRAYLEQEGIEYA